MVRKEPETVEGRIWPGCAVITTGLSLFAFGADFTGLGIVAFGVVVLLVL